MAAFSLATGLRQSNVTYLRWDQVDLQRVMAWIHADQSKSRKAIAVPLNADAIEILKRQQGSNPAYVFTYQDKPVERTTTKAWYVPLVERAGIEDFRWHAIFVIPGPDGTYSVEPTFRSYKNWGVKPRLRWCCGMHISRLII